MPIDTTVDSHTPIPGRSVGSRIVQQFGKPTGLLGHLAGWIMAFRSSNRRRSLWTVEQLNLQSGDRVLEIGFGPGVAVAHAAAHIGDRGRVVGIDPSDVMLGQASRRNAGAIAKGRVDLRVASVEALPDLGAPFAAIYAVNSIGFWPDRPTRLRELAALLATAGRLAITEQPRSRGATAATSARVQARLEADLRAAGLDVVACETLDLDPPAACVIGRRG